ncbi:MAG: cytochrome c oxidase subunit 3 [Acidobacteriota bacterium]
MEQATTGSTKSLAWGGGVNPYGISHKKLGMWLFIVSDALTFTAALFCYSYLRFSSDRWPTPFEIWPSVAVSTLMTFCLLSSSLTMVLAVHHAHLGHRSTAARWLGGTIVGGLAFLILHANEWRGLIAEGMTLTANPWGDPMFGGTFFTITGLHMFHVLSGVCYLGVMALGFRKGKFEAEDVEISGLYWHFVDLVWMFVFPMLYLMSVNMAGGH